MKIIKETARRVIRIRGYVGVCDGCHVPIEYPDDLLMLVIEDTDTKITLTPVDVLVCPNCSHQVGFMFVYKNLDITKELEAIKHDGA